MSEPALKTTADPVASPPETTSPSRPSTRPEKSPLRRMLEALASLQLTVVLFVLSFVLVFFGTVAQVDSGLWTVVNAYFRSAYVWIPLQLFVKFGQVFLGLHKDLVVPGSFPFPGGWLLGGLLLANLLAAHATRFKLTWKRSGVLILHAGLIVLMLGELVAGLYQVESRLIVREGQTVNYVQSSDINELVVIDTSDPKMDDIVAIPRSMLKPGARIADPRLPFDLEINEFMTNSAIEDVVPGTANPATAGTGLTMRAVPRREVSGTNTDEGDDVASAYVTLKDKEDGKSLGTYLVSRFFVDRLDEKIIPQQVAYKGKSYELFLRLKRDYMPYSVYLKEFRHDKYIGTDIPKNYSSLIRLTDPERGEDREVLIYMNEPMRYRGETFYQSGVHPAGDGTILQVVRNPGWLMPYIACVLVTVGMMVHFGLHLVEFLRRRSAV